MRRKATLTMVVATTAIALVLGLSGIVAAAQFTASAELDGFQEVPAISTTGEGSFTALVDDDRQVIRYALEYSGLEGNVTAAHIHLGQEAVNGGIIAFLCGGDGKPACPQSGRVGGTIRPQHIIGPEGQGIAPGEFQEVVRAMRAGVTYANVHSDMFPGGEIRGQISTSG